MMCTRYDEMKKMRKAGKEGTMVEQMVRLCLRLCLCLCLRLCLCLGFNLQPGIGFTKMGFYNPKVYEYALPAQERLPLLMGQAAGAIDDIKPAVRHMPLAQSTPRATSLLVSLAPIAPSPWSGGAGPMPPATSGDQSVHVLLNHMHAFAVEDAARRLQWTACSIISHDTFEPEK